MEEKTNNKVYAVGYGEYSDFEYVAIFSTEEKAMEYLNRYCDLENGVYNGYSLSWWNLDELPEENTYGNSQYGEYCFKFDVDEFDSLEGDTCKVISENSVYFDFKGYGQKYIIKLHIKAKDFPSALKIAKERQTQIIALNMQYTYKGKKVDWYTKEEIE